MNVIKTHGVSKFEIQNEKETYVYITDMSWVTEILVDQFHLAILWIF